MRSALVTGGTGGIGFGIVEALLDDGWQVLASGLGEAEVAGCPERAGLRACRLDVTDEAAVAALVGGLERLDGLVNCAGTIARGGREYEIETFRQVVEVNLVGTMRLCLACKPLLQESGGSIVNIASMLTYFGGPLVPAYSASKGGIGQLTKALAGRWAEDGIRVNAVAPGWIESALTAPLREDPAREQTILGRTPMGRWGRGREVGDMVAHLLSARAGFVTGSIVPVDGGYSAV